jgi:hypothetical protein
VQPAPTHPAPPRGPDAAAWDRRALFWVALAAFGLFAVALSMRIAGLVLVPAWLAAIAWPGAGRVFRRTAVFLAPLAILCAGLALWNHARFGSPLETGYGRFADFGTPLFEGLWRITFASRGGWFLFCPALILAIPGMARLAARDLRAAVVIVLASAAILVVSARYSFSEGGTAYGPRYLVPVTAFAVIPAGLAMTRSRGLARVAAGVLVAASIAIQIPSVIVSHQAYWQIVTAHAPEVRDRLPPRVVADAILARETILHRDDPWDLGVLGVAPAGTHFRTVYPALPGANVWWARAARSYGRPWVMLGAIPFAVLLVLALFRLQRIVRGSEAAHAGGR